MWIYARINCWNKSHDREELFPPVRATNVSSSNQNHDAVCKQTLLVIMVLAFHILSYQSVTWNTIQNSYSDLDVDQKHQCEMLRGLWLKLIQYHESEIAFKFQLHWSKLLTCYSKKKSNYALWY